MNFLSSQLGYLTTDREARTNLRALVKCLAFLGIMVSVYAVDQQRTTRDIEQRSP